ncbi:metalloendoproteinase 2-MMP [Trifolium repens]|nr:metalloendoproteinase 2-MMP [Trifolium repens]
MVVPKHIRYRFLKNKYPPLKMLLLEPNSADILDDTYYSFAVWRIQKNFNLQPTGKIDPDTNNIISKPRCDFPNKIDGSNTLTKITSKQISLKPWWSRGGI